MAPATLRRVALGLVVLAGIVQVIANSFSTIADREGTGIRPWEPWSWELSSLAAWLALSPLIWIAVARLRPPRFGWPAAVPMLVLLTLPLSIAHVAIMVWLRKAVYAFAGSYYLFAENLPQTFLYEYRKDIATSVLLALVFALIQWMVARAGEAPAARPRAMLGVRDGAVVHQVPVDEIEHVASAGNYVDVSWRGRTLLHRATLASLESMLAAHGFVRIHRTRLVRRPAIRRIETARSGDFEVTLESGAILKGSRRYRLDG